MLQGIHEAVPSVVSTSDWCIVIVVESQLSLGLIANTVGVLAIGLGAGHPGLAGGLLRDAEGHNFHSSANQPVPVLQGSAARLSELMQKAWSAPAGSIVVPFPSFARGIHTYAEYQARLSTLNLAREAFDGMGLAGPRKWIRSLTGSLRLLR